MLRFTTALSTNNNEPSSKTAFDKIRNAFVNGMNDAMFKRTGVDLDTDGIIYNEKMDNAKMVNEADFINNKEQKNLNYANVFKQPNTSYSPIQVENPFTLGSDIFNVTNKYREVFNNSVKFISTAVGEKGDKYSMIVERIGTPSLFNPYEAIDALGISENVPLLDYSGKNAEITVNGYENNQKSGNSSFEDIHDCSIANLVKLSKMPTSILGNARYKYSDFMYCAEVGKIPNNHLITLRKFAHPIGDNIYETAARHEDSNNNEIAGDIGRMVTWFGTEDNKLENIINYNFEATWRELKAELQTKQSEELSADRGLLGNLLNMTGKDVGSNISKGLASININKNGPWINRIQMNNGPYANNPVINGDTYDKNKVYEPKDTIRSTHVYEGELKFEHSIKLVFNYKLRSYDGINPKSAFLDLLANILTVTYRNGSFWPGEQRILGVQPNKTGWRKANALIDNTAKAAGTFLQGFLSGNKPAADAVQNSASENNSGNGSGNSNSGENENPQKNLGDMLSNALNGAKSQFNGFMNFIKTGLNNGSFTSLVTNMLSGTLKNNLGRPAVYAFDSLLSSDAVGLWHLTVGNPLNPILSIGNLILKKTEIQQLGPLGFDDFPSDLRVTVTLEHGTPRDSIDIQKMYTKGIKSIYTPIYNYNMKETNNTSQENATMQTEKAQSDPKYAETEEYIRPYSESESNETIGWLGDYSLERIKTNRDTLRI